ncbi:MAG: hypothetical protein EA379_08695 [Phycisphaerales bacterium]|nr:MAG: hypothetical protein EA379_08695 [Phycisphaerales bacterium]
MKKALVVIAILALGAGALYLVVFRGALGVDNWAARQVVRIVNTYLEPDIGFDRFEFRAPGVITFHDVTLTSRDRTRIADVGLMRVTLDGVPRIGQPIVIRAVELEDAYLHLIRDPTGGFKGLIPFVKADNVREQDRVDPEVRLSNVLRIRHIALRNAGVEYDEGDGSPMRLAGLNLELDASPEQEDGEVWHEIVTESALGELAHMHIDGRLNIDRMRADIRAFTLDIELDESSYEVLPPQIQSLVRERDAKGAIAVNISGTADLNDPLGASSINADVRLTDINVAAGEYRLHVDTGAIDARLRDGVATLEQCAFTLLQGEARVSNFHADLNDAAMPLALEWEATGLLLQDLLRTRAEGEPLKIAGLLNSSGAANTSLADPVSALAGKGTVTVREGRFVNLPFITALANAMDVMSRLRRADAQYTDRADIEFDLAPEGVLLTRSEIISSVVGVRATGTIGFDSSLRLNANAGPLERVQGMLGAVGSAMGAITDRLVTYRVRGDLANPEVSVRPLGI